MNRHEKNYEVMRALFQHCKVTGTIGFKLETKHLKLNLYGFKSLIIIDKDFDQDGMNCVKISVENVRTYSHVC